MCFAVSRKPLNQVTSVYDKFSNQLKTITSVIMRDFFLIFFFVQSNCRLLLLLMVQQLLTYVAADVPFYWLENPVLPVHTTEMFII